MTTTIEDHQLEVEINELYLIGRDWLSNLEFMDGEYEFLKKHYNESQKCEIYPDFPETLCQLGQSLAELRPQVTDFLEKLEPLTNGPVRKIGLSLMEDHVYLKRRQEELLATYHAAKRSVIPLSSVVYNGYK
ncbi:hypothetical protein ACXZ1K_12435 [Pedobacter sp. PWIIR3]